MAVHQQFFNSDIGNQTQGMGPQEEVGIEAPYSQVYDAAIRLMEKYETSCAVIVRTFPWRGRSGKWYVKGYDGRFSRDQLLDMIHTNETLYSRRECILVSKHSS